MLIVHFFRARRKTLEMVVVKVEVKMEERSSQES